MDQGGGEVSGFNVEFDRARATTLLGYLDGISDGAEKALYNTLKKVNAKAKTEASNLIRKGSKGQQGLALSKAYVDSKLKTNNPSYAKLQSRLYAARRGILMTRYKYRVNKNGGYDVGINGTFSSPKYKRLPGAFLLPTLKGSGVPGLAIRQNGKLKVLHSPSISQALQTHLDTLRKIVSPFANKVLEQEVNSVLRRKGF